MSWRWRKSWFADIRIALRYTGTICKKRMNEMSSIVFIHDIIQKLDKKNSREKEKQWAYVEVKIEMKIWKTELKSSIIERWIWKSEDHKGEILKRRKLSMNDYDIKLKNTSPTNRLWWRRRVVTDYFWFQVSAIGSTETKRKMWHLLTNIIIGKATIRHVCPQIFNFLKN